MIEEAIELAIEMGKVGDVDGNWGKRRCGKRMA